MALECGGKGVGVFITEGMGRRPDLGPRAEKRDGVPHPQAGEMAHGTLAGFLQADAPQLFFTQPSLPSQLGQSPRVSQRGLHLLPELP